MKFLAILTVGILAIADKNTAKIEFSNIKSTSDRTLCRSPACSKVLEKSASERFSKSELQDCRESVSKDCNFNATVHLNGELNEFCADGDSGLYITNTTDIILQWGEVETSDTKGLVNLQMSKATSSECRVLADYRNYPRNCGPAIIIKGPEEIKGVIATLEPDVIKVSIHPGVFGYLAHYSKYDGMIIRVDGIPTSCGEGIKKIEFSDVSWAMIFEGVVSSANDAIAAKNTARLEFSNIKSKSDSTLCRSSACSKVLERSVSKRISKSEFQSCLESVSVCNFNATVHLNGELNEFCADGGRGLYITNMTDISLLWGVLDNNYEAKGIATLHMRKPTLSKECLVSASDHQLPTNCERGKILEGRGGEKSTITKIERNGIEAFIHPGVFASGVHLHEYNGLLLELEFTETLCGGGISKIELSDVSWIARFQGYGGPTSIPNDASPPAVATGDASCAIISAAAAIPFAVGLF